MLVNGVATIVTTVGALFAFLLVLGFLGFHIILTKKRQYEREDGTKLEKEFENGQRNEEKIIFNDECLFCELSFLLIVIKISQRVTDKLFFPKK